MIDEKSVFQSKKKKNMEPLDILKLEIQHILYIDVYLYVYNELLAK